MREAGVNGVEIGSLIGQIGLPAALVCFFVWHSARRENQLVADIRALEQYQRNELARVLTASIETNNRTCEAIERLDQIARRLEKAA